ncbi:alpha/beta hydrolase [Rhodococcoides kyotonense]|uniref:alpha/beta hydrolase n=1 Tax=Nocardiaceae TaxID=85025 RepID=UPI000AB54696|nr:Diacylglycerol acyltransferase/mycolyltransferase Ag85A [Rhodococcus sp. B10]
MNTRRAIATCTAALLCVLTPSIAGVSSAAAEDLPVAAASSADGSYITSATRIDDRQLKLEIYSAAMDRTIPVQVMTPADGSVSRPVLYLLNGAGGGEDSASWQSQTDSVQFFQDKNAFVVTPQEGKWSYYTDWIADDPVLGRNKWQTFIGEELPPLIDAQFDTNGVQSIAALSMSGTSVLNLAIAYPGQYRGVAAYSGCAQTSDPLSQQFVKLVVETYGGGNVENMWGPLDGPVWRENDPILHAEQLRGTEIYMSTGTGLPGIPHDTPLNPRFAEGKARLFPDQLIVGGGIEAVVNFCTSNMAKELYRLGIPAQVDFRPVGTHSWGYWQDDLHASWPMLARSMGI